MNKGQQTKENRIAYVEKLYNESEGAQNCICWSGRQMRTELYMLNPSGVVKKAMAHRVVYVEQLKEVIRSSLRTTRRSSGHQVITWSTTRRSSGHQVILTEVIRSSGHHLVNHKVITFADLWRSRKQRRTNCIC